MKTWRERYMSSVIAKESQSSDASASGFSFGGMVGMVEPLEA